MLSSSLRCFKIEPLIWLLKNYLICYLNQSHIFVCFLKYVSYSGVLFYIHMLSVRNGALLLVKFLVMLSCPFETSTNILMK